MRVFALLFALTVSATLPADAIDDLMLEHESRVRSVVDAEIDQMMLEHEQGVRALVEAEKDSVRIWIDDAEEALTKETEEAILRITQGPIFGTGRRRSIGGEDDEGVEDPPDEGGNGNGGGGEIPPPSAELSVVTTFESAGLYFDQDDTSSSATVRYRTPAGSGTWKDGIDMDYDPNAVQWRSSIVLLDAGTEYEVEVTYGGETFSETFTTWTETANWPISDTVNVSTTSGYDITVGGSAETGYRVYDGSASTIDGGPYCVRIAAEFVIVRNFTCVNQDAGKSVIYVEHGIDDVLIEHNEISEWGDGGSPNNDHEGNAIEIEPLGGNYTGPTENTRIVIQYNNIHDPAWGPNPDNYASSAGPRGVHYKGASNGNIVIRYNTITGDWPDGYSDPLGGGVNQTLTGYPGKDSDIYGNYLTHCVDDCIEAEGGGENVRIWNNYMDNYFVGIGTAAVWKGPLYIFRNVGGGQSDKGGHIKVGGNKNCNDCNYAEKWQGASHIYHNTFAWHTTYTQTDGTAGRPSRGQSWGGEVRNQRTRNNIFITTDIGIAEETCYPSNQLSDLDYDLWRKRTIFNCGTKELNGIEVTDTTDVWGTFTYPLLPGQDGTFTYTSGTYGHDQGTVVKNFSDGWTGSAPDMGVMEHDDATPMCFGHNC